MSELLFIKNTSLSYYHNTTLNTQLGNNIFNNFELNTVLSRRLVTDVAITNESGSLCSALFTSPTYKDNDCVLCIYIYEKRKIHIAPICSKHVPSYCRLHELF